MMMETQRGFGRRGPILKENRACRRAFWLLAVAGAACGDKAPPAVPASAPASTAASLAPPAPGAEDTDTSERVEVEPVYPKGPVPPDARAQRLCTALYELPARHRATCCGRPPPKADQAAAECTRLLSFSLAQGAVALDEAAVSECLAALEKEAPACGVLGRLPARPPAACQRVLAGKRAAGAACRSNLECEGSLQCNNAGPTQAGTCAGPRPLGAPCAGGSDVLATYTRQVEVDRAHPECDGYCGSHRCQAITPVDGACKVNLECGPGRACASGKCVEAPKDLAVGAACPGLGCAEGLRCVAGACLKPASAGAACGNDFECEGVCVKKNILDNAGVCGTICQ